MIPDDTDAITNSLVSVRNTRDISADAVRAERLPSCLPFFLHARHASTRSPRSSLTAYLTFITVVTDVTRPRILNIYIYTHILTYYVLYIYIYTHTHIPTHTMRMRHASRTHDRRADLTMHNVNRTGVL